MSLLGLNPHAAPMQTLEPPSPDFDELADLEFQIARRADELMRAADNRGPTRDFWREAEEEIWNSRLQPLAWTSIA